VTERTREKNTVKLFNSAGQLVAELAVKASAVEAKVNEQLVHDYVVQLQNSRRAWSASTKTRGEVKASGVKPGRQKGTGRARAGSLASPLFRGGGVTFGPKPKVVKNRFPRRMKRLVFDHALAEKIRHRKLMVVDEVRFESPKTKRMAEALKSLNVSGKVLLVADKTDRNALLSARNIPHLTYRSLEDVSAYDILRHEFLLLTKASFDLLHLAEPPQDT
jgi:large subunit ribosomal protein L4